MLKHSCFILSRRIYPTNVRTHFSNQKWSNLNAVIPYRDRSLQYVKTKFNTALTWYEEISGLREVREAQIRVLMATEMMKAAQIKRRDAKTPIVDQQKRLQDLQPELRNTPRDDDRYLYLIKEEHALLKDLKSLQERVQEAENEEREAFEQLMTSLRSSHEAERVQAEKTKYWSIIMSIIATIIGVVGTSLNNRYKMNQFRSMVEQSNGTEKLKALLEETSNSNISDHVINRLNDISKNIDLVKNFTEGEVKMNAQVIGRLNYIGNKVDSLSSISVVPKAEETPPVFFVGVVVGILFMWLFR